MTDRVVVTGGLGFIGSAFIRRLASEGVDVLNLDLDTYAGDETRIREAGPGSTETIRVDVTDPITKRLIAQERPAAIVHLAAESHVTRSESAAERFFRTNVEGTRHVLEAAVDAGGPPVIHISTDEVYGPCLEAPFKEEDKAPGEGKATSAYARSKAVADDLARAFMAELPVVIARLSNCFGPWQHPEKAVPRWITRALRGQRIPIWGSGMQVRDWMFVADAADAIALLLRQRRWGEIYNVAPMAPEKSNLEIAREIARIAGAEETAVYLSAYDRPQHDVRYAIDASKISALGWSASTVDDRLADAVDWYASHIEWWEPLIDEAEALYQDAAEGA